MLSEMFALATRVQARVHTIGDPTPMSHGGGVVLPPLPADPLPPRPWWIDRNTVCQDGCIRIWTEDGEQGSVILYLHQSGEIDKETFLKVGRAFCLWRNDPAEAKKTGITFTHWVTELQSFGADERGMDLSVASTLSFWGPFTTPSNRIRLTIYPARSRDELYAFVDAYLRPSDPAGPSRF